MLDDARDRVVAKQAPNVQQASALLELEAIQNSLANLRTFPCINILESKGKLTLHGAHFDISSGTLRVLNPATNEFTSV